MKINYHNPGELIQTVKALANRYGITYEQALLSLSEFRVSSVDTDEVLIPAIEREEEALKIKTVPDHIEVSTTISIDPEKQKRKTYDASKVDNLKLRSPYKGSTTGILGVCLNRGKYVAQICKDRKVHYLGSYSDLESAVAARKQAEIRLGFHH